MFDKLKDLGQAASSLSDLVGGMKGVADSMRSSRKEIAGSKHAQSCKYSPELEEMIAMAIEEGNLSDREIQLLAKRAQREGVDPDEFEFDLSMRLKKASRSREEKKNMNPVEALSQTLAMMEQYAKGGKKVVDPSALSGLMSLIPGVGPLAAAGGLLGNFIQTPSNLNKLKAEVIRKFILPENAEHLVQFINYAVSQQAQTQNEKISGMSIKSVLSSVALGSDIDLAPVWELKLEEACDKAVLLYPSDPMVAQTVKKNRPTLLRKLQSGRVSPFGIPGKSMSLSDVTAPADDEELLDVVEFAFAKKGSDDWDEWKAFHSRMYKEAEFRCAGNAQKLSRLSKYKVKKFGLF